MKPEDVLQFFLRFLRWMASLYRALRAPRVRGASIIEITAYVALGVSVFLLFFPTEHRITASLWLLIGSMLLIFVGQARNLSEIELAILVVVLTQVASAKWSMLLDKQAVDRANDAESRQESRERDRDRLADERRIREAVEQDGRNLNLVREGLWDNYRATRQNEAVLDSELIYLSRGMINVLPTWPINLTWWQTAIERRPSAIVGRTALLDSLRYVYDVAALVSEMYNDRRNYMIHQEGQGVQVVGQPEPFHRRVRKLDQNLLLESRELCRVIKNFQSHFERDTSNHRQP